jgi:L-threonylcarbamoyladenylate synthase
VREDLGDEVDLVLEGGPSEVGIESTILDLSRGAPRVLRPGHILQAAIENLLGTRLGSGASSEVRHPGGLEHHYAPRTPARLLAPHELDKEIARLRERVAVLAFSRPDERVEYWLRMPREPQAYAHRLYAALRELDTAGCEMMLIEAPPDTPEWAAVRDRLRRACGQA